MKFFFIILFLILVISLYVDVYYKEKDKLPIYVIDRNYEQYTSTKPKSSLKIFNLVLYSKSDEYNEMKRITENYYTNFDFVTTIYYMFSENQDEPYQLEGNMLYIKGKESYIPGITEKTKRAIFYFKDDYTNYDYVVRSNISTIINFDLLADELEKHPIDYGSGLTFHLEKVQIENNTHETIYDVKYASGTSIIMSRKVIQKMVEKNEMIKVDVIDDVALGIFVKEYLPDVKTVDFVPDKYLFVSDTKGDNESLKQIVKEKDYIFYRNRVEDRKTDVKQMQEIVNVI